MHGGHGAGGAGLLGGSGHGRVGHKAKGLPVQLGKARLGDARQRHVGVGDDGRARVHGLCPGGNGPGGELQVLRVVKIGGRMDDPLDDGGVLGQDRQPALGKFLGDDAHARALDIGRQVMLRGHRRSSLGAASPMAA